MINEDFKRDIEILMADQDVQFNLKNLKIRHLSTNQIHILDWLLLKSPKLIDLDIDSMMNHIEGRGLKIYSELKIKKLEFTIDSD
jgi:hypothetical protein